MNKSNYKIVKVDDKFYAVQGKSTLGNFYCGINGEKHYNPALVREWCLFDDYIKALDLLKLCQDKEDKNRPLKIQELS